MPDSAPAAALATGAVVVTPNNRLARALAEQHDRAQAAAGLAAWPTPRALPWNAWLASIWLDALAADAWPSPPALLNATQAARLWERAVAADALELLDTRGAAERAAHAWTTFHAHAEAQETPAQFNGGGDDAAAFARWARRFERSAADVAAIDIAQLPQSLVAALARRPFVDGRAFVFAGFVEFTPQQTRLIDALRAARAQVEILAAGAGGGAGGGTCARAQYRTSTDELVAALQWARARTLADAAAYATIAVVDLSARLPLTLQLADEILCPQAVARARLDGARPYNVSLAPPLADHPLAVAALDLLELARQKLPLARAAALVRSPYLAGGAASAARRARHERGWRQRNLTDLSLNGLIQEIGDDDPLRRGLLALSQSLRHAPPRSPHAWADTFVAALRGCGWPGSDAQSSAVYQAYAALSRAIGEWRSLALVEPRMDAAAALPSLRAHCARMTFQPETAPTRIQVLGVLEAAGLGFDGLWLAGMDADAWPPRVVPEPFLPVSWQRARGVAQASAERSLLRAERLTTQLVASARDVVASHVASTDHPPRGVSPLCNWPLSAHPPQPTPTMRAIASAAALAHVDDTMLPALAVASRIRGGVRVIELQSDCAFRAAASLRLHADAWSRPGIGLTAMERGNLVHVAMAALWKSLHDQATLRALDDVALRKRIDAAVRVAQGDIADARWRAMPPVVAGVEASRLADLVFAFLRRHEAERPPFRVLANEEEIRLAIGGLDLGLRIDRVDAIDGGVAVIDYKTGRLPPVRQWLLERPVAPQTGLYALALRQRDPAIAVRAAALVSIRSGAFDKRGIADAAVRWEGLATPAEASGESLVDFAALERWWQASFGALAEAFRNGDAAVLPRDKPNPCEQCDFKPFCRIDLHTIDDDGEREDAQ